MRLVDYLLPDGDGRKAFLREKPTRKGTDEKRDGP